MRGERSTLPLRKRSPLSRRYSILLARARALLREYPPPDAGRHLQLLDALAQLLNHQLFPRDQYALDAELLFLEFPPEGSKAVLAALSRTRLHLLFGPSLAQGDADRERSLTQVCFPIPGTPLGMHFQPVGIFGDLELLVFSSHRGRLTETRLADLEGAMPVVTSTTHRAGFVPLSLVDCKTASGEVVQALIRSVHGEGRRVHFELCIRRSGGAEFTPVYSVRHGLGHLCRSLGTLYLVAHPNRILGFEPRVGGFGDAPAEIVELETPSPVQGLAAYETAQGTSLLAVTADGTVFGIDPARRRLKWRYDAGRSLTCLSVRQGAEPLIALGSPDGLLELVTPEDPSRASRIVDALLFRIAPTRSRLAALCRGEVDRLGQEEDASAPASVPSPFAGGPDGMTAPSSPKRPTPMNGDRAVGDRLSPQLRLLAVDRLLGHHELDDDLSTIIEENLLAIYDEAERGGPLSTAEVIRFLSYLTWKATHPGGDASCGEGIPLSPRSEKTLIIVFRVLESLQPILHGDTRRRLERLLRRVHGDWLPLSIFERLRDRHAPGLQLERLSALSLKRLSRRLLSRAEEEEDRERKIHFLLRAMAASWRRFLRPIERLGALQGFHQAIPIEAGGGRTDPLLAALASSRLHILTPADGEESLLESCFSMAFPGVRRIAAGVLRPGLQGVVAATKEALIPLALRGDASPVLEVLGGSPFPIREPVTCLELLSVSLPLADEDIPLLALGQADGSLRLLRLEPDDAGDLTWTESFRMDLPAGVHHIAALDWPESPSLIIGADTMTILTELHVDERGRLDGTLHPLDFSAPVTAFTVARPNPSRADAARPILVVGLANGLIQAFQSPGNHPTEIELCWEHRAPQVITDLTWLEGPVHGWFTAAADDGTLYLLSHGHTQHHIVVERYPFALRGFRIPRLDPQLLLVSSPAGVVTILEIAGEAIVREMDELSERLELLVDPASIPRLLEREGLPNHVALSYHHLSAQPFHLLVAYYESHREETTYNETNARAYVRALLDRAADEVQAREQALIFLGELLSDPGIPDSLKCGVFLIFARSDLLPPPAAFQRLFERVALGDEGTVKSVIDILDRYRTMAPEGVDEGVLWRTMHRILTVDPPKRERMHVAGPLCRKLLSPRRDNLLELLDELRGRESGLPDLCTMVGIVLTAPWLLADSVLKAVLSAYADLGASRGTEALRAGVVGCLDALEAHGHLLRGADVERAIMEEVRDALSLSEYDDYSHFRVNAEQFFPRLKASGRYRGILEALDEVRLSLHEKTSALTESFSASGGFEGRIQALRTQADCLERYAEEWSRAGSLEKRLVAAMVDVWSAQIVLPEIHRLQDCIELVIEDASVALTGDGTFAEICLRVRNLGGKALESFHVALDASDSDAYLWEGRPQWFQGPIRYGQGIIYRTGVLLDEGISVVRIGVRVRYREREEAREITIHADVKVHHEEGGDVDVERPSWAATMPVSFDVLLKRLERMPPGRLLVLMAADARERQGVMAEGVAGLRGTAPGRALIEVDLVRLLETPLGTPLADAASWWPTLQLARLMRENRLVEEAADALQLRNAPDEALGGLLARATQGRPALWIVVHRGARALAGQEPRLRTAIIDWILRLSRDKVRVVVPADFGMAHALRERGVRRGIAVELVDLEMPGWSTSVESADEYAARARRLLLKAAPDLSEAVLQRLLAHTGANVLLVRRMARSLERIESRGWLSWQGRAGDVAGSPRELNEFLDRELSRLSAPFRERLRTLSFAHRLALSALASGSEILNRKLLRPGMSLDTDLHSRVKSKTSRPKRLYSRHDVLTGADVRYLRDRVGEIAEPLKIAAFRGPDLSIALSHLLVELGLDRLIEDLRALHLIRKEQGRRAFYTIALPIHRRWLVEALPFRRGEEEQLRLRLLGDESLSDVLPLEALAGMKKRLRSPAHTAAFLEFLGLTGDAAGDAGSGQVSARRWERLGEMARRMLAWRRRPAPETLRALGHAWALFFDGRIEDHASSVIPNKVDVVGVDVSHLRIPRLRRLLLFGPRSPLSSLEIEMLQERVRHARSLSVAGERGGFGGGLGFVCAPPGGSGEHWAGREALEEGSAERLYLLNLPERAMVATALGKEGRRAFLELLSRSGFRFQHLSPYQSLGALRGGDNALFVGRDAEIDRVLRQPRRAFAIVGARKIGKTSLLLRLEEELRRQLGAHAHILYIECSESSPAMVWRMITDKLKMPPVDPRNARAEMQVRLSRLRSPVVLLLDEIDGVYSDADENSEKEAERFMWDLRGLAADGTLRLILAGYIRIYERRQDSTSAFHNFTTFIRLAELTPEAARKLVVTPMEQLGISFANQQLVKRILERTWQVPWIIQFFCDQLIRRLDERLAGDRHSDRRILGEDVENTSVQVEEELYSYFTNPLVMSAVQQLILLAMVEAGCSRFNEADIRDVLEARFGRGIWRLIRYEELTKRLENLTLTLALTVESGVYSFPLDMYPAVVRGRLGDVRPRLDRLYERLRGQRDS